MSKNKFYAVKRGRVPGIYTDINEYMKQVVEFPGHSSRGFKTELEAIQWLSQKQPNKKNGDNSKIKYYVVRVGRVPGIYTDVDEYRKQVDGFSLSVSKKFKNYDEACAWYKKKKKPSATINVNERTEEKIKSQIEDALKNDSAVAYVDGSFDELNKKYAFGAVIRYRNKEYMISGVRNDPSKVQFCNMAGEMESVMEAIKWAKKRGVHKIIIVHDCKMISTIAKSEGKARGAVAIEYKNFYDKESKVMEIEFSEVRGHSGNKMNDLADALARQALGKSIKKSLSDYIVINNAALIS